MANFSILFHHWYYFLCCSLRPSGFEFLNAEDTEKFTCLPAGAKTAKFDLALLNNQDLK